MLSPANIRANVLVKLGELTGKTHALPLVLFSPTARCNSRCISCDWWRADGAGDLSLAEIETLAGDLERAGTRVVVLTGGEPLVRPDVMAVADLFRARGMALQLLTSGLALGRYADDVAARFQTVTVSLDGHTPELYRAIRGVDGLGAVADGVRKLRARAPHVGITARATIHRHNFRFLPDLVAKSRAMGLDQISFLAANVDASSEAFNRRAGLPQASDGDGSPARLLLNAEEVEEFAAIVETAIRLYPEALGERRIAQDPAGLRRLVALLPRAPGAGDVRRAAL